MRKTVQRVKALKKRHYSNDIKEIYKKEKVQIEPLHIDFSSAVF